MSACGGVAAAQSLPAPPSAKIVSSVVLARLPGGFNERLAVVARAGLQSVELLGDEHGRWTDTDLAGIRRSLRSYNLTVDLIGPEPASAAPAQFMTELSRQLALARKLEAPMLLIAPGETDDRGFRAIAWNSGTVRYVAVSDAAPDEIAAFVAAFQTATAGE